jgi:lysophospholipase L1-like esterase
LGGGFYDASFVTTAKAKLNSTLTSVAQVGGKMTSIGDSITEGTGEWDENVASRFSGLTLVDKGVSGDTSKEVLARISNILSTNADVYIMDIGINDIRHNDSSEGAVTVEEYIYVMGQIIDRLQTTRKPLFVISIWPTYNGDVSPAETNVFGTVAQTNAEIDIRNEALKKLCMSKCVYYIDATTLIRSTITSANQSQYISDGPHPNAAGAQIYAQAVLYDSITL